MDLNKPQRQYDFFRVMTIKQIRCFSYKWDKPTVFWGMPPVTRVAATSALPIRRNIPVSSTFVHYSTIVWSSRLTIHVCALWNLLFSLCTSFDDTRLPCQGWISQSSVVPTARSVLPRECCGLRGEQAEASWLLLFALKWTWRFNLLIILRCFRFWLLWGQNLNSNIAWSQQIKTRFNTCSPKRKPSKNRSTGQDEAVIFGNWATLTVTLTLWLVQNKK